MFDAKNFTTQKARPLPIFLLLDKSTSMSGEKISTLNDAVKTMLETFSDTETVGSEIHVGMILFGADIDYRPLAKAQDVLETWKTIEVSGSTPMGGALKQAKSIIEDKEQVPSRSYRPTFILISDGAPTDEWKTPMEAFIKDGRSSKCQRMSMGIGHEASKEPLEMFIQGTEGKVFEAKDAKDIQTFFQFVTMSITSRSKSQNPDVITSIEAPVVDVSKPFDPEF